MGVVKEMKESVDTATLNLKTHPYPRPKLYYTWKYFVSYFVW